MPTNLLEHHSQHLNSYSLPGASFSVFEFIFACALNESGIMFCNLEGTFCILEENFCILEDNFYIIEENFCNIEENFCDLEENFCNLEENFGGKIKLWWSYTSSTCAPQITISPVTFSNV